MGKRSSRTGILMACTRPGCARRWSRHPEIGKIVVVINLKKERYGIRIDHRTHWGNSFVIGKHGDRKKVIAPGFKVTPAMEAGLTDRLWDIADLVAIVDANGPALEKRGRCKNRISK